MSSLEEQIAALTAKTPNQFEEPHDGFSMPGGNLLKVSNGNVLVIAFGLIFSTTVGGFIGRWLSGMAKYSSIIAGLAIMYLGKSKPMLRDFGVGVLLGGLAQVFGHLGSSLLGGAAPEAEMQETRVTYGGTDGVYPTNPDRRVFS